MRYRYSRLFLSFRARVNVPYRIVQTLQTDAHTKPVAMTGSYHGWAEPEIFDIYVLV